MSFPDPLTMILNTDFIQQGGSYLSSICLFLLNIQHQYTPPRVMTNTIVFMAQFPDSAAHLQTRHLTPNSYM